MVVRDSPTAHPIRLLIAVAMGYLRGLLRATLNAAGDHQIAAGVTDPVAKPCRPDSRIEKSDRALA
jgi:hypothetical protein